MNDAQYSRYKNALNTRMSVLLDKKDSQGNRHFLIQSTTSRYKVSIYKKSGNLTCSCPDYSMQGKSQETVCKHILFVIMTHLKIITRIDHSFFTRTSGGSRPTLTRDEF